MEFSKYNIINTSWEGLKRHLGLWILIMLFVFCFNIIISIVQDRLLDNITTQTILFTVAAYLFQAGLNLGMLKIAINTHKDKEVEFNQVFGSFEILVPYILATFIFNLFQDTEFLYPFSLLNIIDGSLLFFLRRFFA